MIATPDIRATIAILQAEGLEPIAAWKVFERGLGPVWCHPVTWEHLRDAMVASVLGRPPEPPQAREFRRRHPPSRQQLRAA